MRPRRANRLDRLLERRALDSVWLLRPANAQWLVGADTRVAATNEVGVAALGYDGHAVTAVVPNNEESRLENEELPSSVSVQTFSWTEGTVRSVLPEVTSGDRGADVSLPGFEQVDMTRLREPLTETDRTTIRHLGAETAAALEAVAREVTRGQTERSVAANLQRRLATVGIAAPVLLVGGGNRAPQYRHLIPTDQPVGDYAIISVTGRRNGLHVSCSRTIAFTPPDWLQDRHHDACHIEATALTATQHVGSTNGTADEIFDAITQQYAAREWPEEWTAHHQGGATGYAGREWVATPDSDRSVVLPMGFAWNPTVAGAKSEDTYLITETDIEAVTVTDDWPMQSVTLDDRTIDRPAIYTPT